ncbi:hypothetical protein TH63_13600 [Rufibacter radiotolerans]|uniref:Uncharacterized protein n=1 Tax=Rufibacter radiotolerans TaxID=1379910 RepID=A0A0H4VRL3_9BACT|nr:hypothetical protein TH63_13600 [Rufibacter radiotolerans]
MLHLGHAHATKGRGYADSTPPRPESWEKLLAFLAGCTWEKEYVNGTCDGIQWELKAKGPGIKLKSWGSNEYPPDFKVFLQLLNECIAGAGFRIS